MKRFNVSKPKSWLLTNYSYSNSKRSARVLERVSESPNNWEWEIKRRIVSGEPMLFGRLGGLEASCLGIYLDLSKKYKRPLRYLQGQLLLPRRQKQLCTNAGVFPVDQENFNYFANEHLEALEQLDVFSVWAKPSAWVEFNYLRIPETLFVTGDASYPWPESRDGESSDGWGMALDGKSVLVVSPFVDSFEEQSRKLSKVFTGINYPNMKLDFLRAPLTQGGLDDGTTYKSHLLNLKKLMSERVFDIALISAGAYSLPLAHHAKQMGKIGIHAGGALQLFFGVTGQRYDTYSQVTKFFNESWKRPFEHERPPNWREIESGCYW